VYSTQFNSARHEIASAFAVPVYGVTKPQVFCFINLWLYLGGIMILPVSSFRR